MISNKFALIPLMLAAALGSQAAFAAGEGHGTITLNGKVTHSTCTLNNPTVDLGSVADSKLAQPNDMSNFRKVDLTLTCTSAEKGKVQFSGAQDAKDSTLYKSDGTADNVAVGLYSTASTINKLDPSDLTKTTMPYENKDADKGIPKTYSIYAAMVATGAAGEGTVHSVVDVDLTPEP